MSQNVPFKSSFRQPIRTIFLILLVGAISFAFVSKAIEYIVVQRETDRLGGYFRSIGSLERTDKDQFGDVSQGAKLILGSSYLAYEDRQKYSSGVMQGIWNPDTDGMISDNTDADLIKTGLHNSDFWFYGTLKKLDRETSGFGWYKLTFQVDKVLAGFPENISANTSIDLLFVLKDHQDSLTKIEAMLEGQRYLIRGWFDYGSFNTSTVQIRAINDADLWYIPVDAGAELDLNSPSMLKIKNAIDVLNENQHALLLNGTTDMSALPIMQQSSHMYYLVDGRWLNHQDELDGRRVIAISKGFADARLLKVGDTIAMTLRGLKDNWAPYIAGKDIENWRSYPTVQETFEIVGIYEKFTGSTTFEYIYAYVPNSVLPADIILPSDKLYAQSYSFVLDSSRNQDTFVNQYKAPLAKLGLNLTFVENNGAAFWAGVLPLQRSALTGLLIYSLVLILALTLAVFLYLTQRRKDYAILRALGVPKGRANLQVLLPILYIGMASIFLGEIPAWIYALSNTAKTFSKLPTPAGIAPSTTLSLVYFGAFGLGLLLLVFIFAIVGVWILSAKPVLELLGRAVPAGGARQRATSFPPGPSAAQETSFTGQLLENTTTNRSPKVAKLERRRGAAGTKALARFGFRSIKRNGLKSSLTALVALGLAVALGWMQWTMEKDRAEVNRLYSSTTVEADVVEAGSGFYGGGGFVSKNTVEQLLASGFIKSAYLEATTSIIQMNQDNGSTNNQPVNLSILAFDQPDTFFTGLTTRDTVQYGTGWDESLFRKKWNSGSLSKQGTPGIFPDSILKAFGLKLGDEVELQDEYGMTNPYYVVGQYTPGPRQISANILQYEGEPILVPLSALKLIEGKNLYYSTVNLVVDPAKNRDINTFEAQARKIVAELGAGRLPLKIHFWDEELRAVVEPMEKNLSLLGVLYPVTLAISALIGAGLCLLILLQQAREAALLRTLGTGKAGVRAMLCMEQVLLSLAGMLLGLVVLGLLRKSFGTIFTMPALIAIGCYLLGTLMGSLIGAISVSNRKPLDLLQVKE
jgi:ABC-type antimicrobial peptide transport system permease subunit